MKCYDNALKLAKELRLKKEIASVLGNMGIAYKTKGDLNKALEYYKKALGIFKELGIKIEIARTLMNIGDIFVMKGKNGDAMDYYLEAQELTIDLPWLFEETKDKINTLLGVT